MGTNKNVGPLGSRGLLFARLSRFRTMPLHHAKCVAALGSRLAGEFVHEFAHEEDAATARSELGGVEGFDGVEVEGVALVVDANLDSLGTDEALDLERRVGPTGVGMTDDIIRALVAGEDDGMCGTLVEPGDLTDRFDEGACERQ